MPALARQLPQAQRLRVAEERLVRQRILLLCLYAGQSLQAHGTVGRVLFLDVGGGGAGEVLDELGAGSRSIVSSRLWER